MNLKYFTKKERFYFFFLVIMCVVLNISAAYTTAGYLQDDEHFQILEFLNLKLGKPALTTWEYAMAIRPWAQIFIYYLSSKLYISVFNNIDNFQLAHLLRIETSILSAIAQTFFLYTLINIIRDKLAYWILAVVIFTFWFFPFLSARTSSENFSNIAILFSFGFFMNSIRNKEEFHFNKIFQNLEYSHFGIFFTAIFLSFAFQFRYQTAFLCIGMFLWMFVNTNRKFRFLSLFMTGFLLVFIICTYIDKWGYGAFYFVPYRYFYENIMQGRANSFGESGLFYYTDQYAYLFNPIVGYTFLCLLLISFVRFYKSIFVWSSFLFILAHYITSHKETRFLFPMIAISFVPISCLISGFFRYEIKGFNKIKNYSLKTILLILYCLNLISIFKTMNGMIGFNFRHLKNMKDFIVLDNLYVSENNPLLTGQKFYTGGKINKLNIVSSLEDYYNKVIPLNKNTNLLFEVDNMEFMDHPYYKNHCSSFNLNLIHQNLLSYRKKEFVNSILQIPLLPIFIQCKN